MARPKTQVNRKNDIISAAQMLFNENGFEKTTIEDIAQRAGISKGSVYLEFKNKDEILLAFIEVHALESLALLERKIEESTPPYLELIRKLYYNKAAEAFELATCQYQSYTTLMNTNYKIRQGLRHIHQKHLDIIALILNKAVENGEIEQCASYKDLAHSINICFQGFFPPYDFKYSIEHRQDLSKDEIRKLLLKGIENVIDLVLYGLTRTNAIVK